MIFSACTALDVPEHSLIWRVNEFIMSGSFFVAVFCGVFFWAYAWVKVLECRKGNLLTETELLMLVGTLAFGSAMGVYWHLADRKRQGGDQPHADDQ
ncbi:MAG: hypothetical protein R3F19_15320 [Verrucomicrobiales bacterium]